MSKGLVYLIISIGSTIGAYLPVLLFHADVLSLWSGLGGIFGAIGAGIAVYRMGMS